MKMLALIPSLLLIAACASSNTQLAMQDGNDSLCGNHKKDYEFFHAKFAKEHDEACSNGCVYTPALNKSSDTMQRIAGNYYLMNCDQSHGRL